MNDTWTKITVALLSGGSSSEREISIKGGDQVYEALNKNLYHVIRYDPACDLARLCADARDIDVALVVLHGEKGEDGTVQGLLELLRIPYQCSGPLGSAVAMNKLASKKLYEAAGIAVPAYLGVKKGEPVNVADWVARLGLPLVVKPAGSGSSIGISIAREEKTVEQALKTAFSYDDTVLLEEYIAGTEITGAVIGNKVLEALPIVEIIPAGHHEYFDFTAKYTAGETNEICPARIGEPLARQARDLACRAHEALFCQGYSRTDMILSGDNTIYVLETNTIPGMTPASLLPLAAKGAGMPFPRLLDRLIELGLARNKGGESKGGNQ